MCYPEKNRTVRKSGEDWFRGGFGAAFHSSKKRMELLGCHRGPRNSFRASSLFLQSLLLQLQITATLGYIICNITARKKLIVKSDFSLEKMNLP